MSYVPRLKATRLLLALLCTATLSWGATAPAIFAQIEEMTTTLCEITGWRVHKKVPSQVLTKIEFQHYLSSHIKDSSQDKETRAGELALKLFGLVPRDFNLARETTDLLGEQAAAFYDYKKKRLYIIDSTPEGDEQQQALVHELAHALADQQHSLGKYLNHGSPNADESSAREAVMEGQATWLTWAYQAKRATGKAEIPPGFIEQATETRDNPDFPVLANTPLYMRESLLFPYNTGVRFQEAVFRKMGREAFEAVFARGPLSTQQVMHPADYFTMKMPTMPALADADKLLGKQARLYHGLIEGSVGEFDHNVLLRQYVGEQDGARAAELWQGGWFRIYERKKAQNPLLVYASEWATPEAAREYLKLYQQILKGKWKKMEVKSATAAEVTGTGDSGDFVLRLSGSVFQSIEGLPRQGPEQF